DHGAFNESHLRKSRQTKGEHLDQTRKPKRVWLHNIAIFYVPKKVQGKKWSCQSLGSTNKYHMT
ncbi:hypothetical protein AT3G14467, partial [Arabidopsis thaliana]